MIQVQSVVQLHQAGLLDKFFGEKKNPLDQALKAVAKDYYKRVQQVVPKFLAMIKKASSSHGVNQDYLNYVIFRDRSSWPVRGEEAVSLAAARDIAIEFDKTPDLQRAKPDHDGGVDKAVQAVARWANTDMGNQLYAMLMASAAVESKSLRRKLDFTEFTPADIAKYIVDKLADKLKFRSLTVENGNLLDTIINRVAL